MFAHAISKLISFAGMMARKLAPVIGRIEAYFGRVRDTEWRVDVPSPATATGTDLEPTASAATGRRGRSGKATAARRDSGHLRGCAVYRGDMGSGSHGTRGPVDARDPHHHRFGVHELHQGRHSPGATRHRRSSTHPRFALCDARRAARAVPPRGGRGVRRGGRPVGVGSTIRAAGWSAGIRSFLSVLPHSAVTPGPHPAARAVAGDRRHHGRRQGASPRSRAPTRSVH